MDFDVQRCTRHCAASGRELAEREVIYSVLVQDGARIERLDYAADAWPGPPPGAIGWWKSRLPDRGTKKNRLAPNDVMLELFHELAGNDQQQDLRYVLALLMIRRRILRLEETTTQGSGQEMLVLYNPRDESTHQLPAGMPSEQRLAEIQNELGRLLFSGAG